MMTSAFTILSFNVYSGPFSSSDKNIIRYKEQIKQIQQKDPDIVCLQEYNTHEIEEIYRQRMLELGYDSYVARRSFSSILRSAISSSFLLGHPGVRKFTLGNQEFGLAIWWKKNRFSVFEQNCVSFDTIGEDPLTFIRKRGYLTVVLSDKLNLKQIQIVNTHMNLRSENDRYLQTKELLHKIKRTIPTVVVGDLNVFHDKEKSVTLFKLHNFEDVFRFSGPTFLMDNENTDWFAKVQGKTKRCDYLFAKDVRVLNSTIVSGKSLYSDHEGLLAKIYTEKN